MAYRAKVEWRPVHDLPPSTAQDGCVVVGGAAYAIEIRPVSRDRLNATVAGNFVAIGRTMRQCKSAIEQIAHHHPERLRMHGGRA